MSAGVWRRSRRSFSGGDDEGDAAVAFLAAVEQPEHGLDDPARRLVVVDRDRSLVEPCVGIRRGVFTVDDGDATEVGVGDAIGVHVPTGMERDPGGGGEEPVRRIPRQPRWHRRDGAAHVAEAHPRSFVEGPVAHDDIGGARRDRERGLHDRAGGGAPAVGDAREHREVRDPEVARDFRLLAAVEREGDEPVDIGGP